MKNTNRNRLNNNRQQGMALVIAMIMLLLITILGVSAVRMSTLNTQVAGNSIFAGLVFQGAESALSRSLSSKDLSNLPAAATAHGTDVDIHSDYFPSEAVLGGAVLNSSGIISFELILNAPVLNSVANSSEFNYQVFKVRAQSNLASTSARDRHTEGRAVQIPKQH